MPFLSVSQRGFILAEQSVLKKKTSLWYRLHSPSKRAKATGTQQHWSAPAADGRAESSPGTSPPSFSKSNGTASLYAHQASGPNVLFGLFIVCFFFFLTCPLGFSCFIYNKVAFWMPEGSTDPPYCHQTLPNTVVVQQVVMGSLKTKPSSWCQ